MTPPNFVSVRRFRGCVAYGCMDLISTGLAVDSASRIHTKTYRHTISTSTYNFLGKSRCQYIESLNVGSVALTNLHITMPYIILPVHKNKMIKPEEFKLQ